MYRYKYHTHPEVLYRVFKSPEPPYLIIFHKTHYDLKNITEIFSYNYYNTKQYVF